MTSITSWIASHFSEITTVLIWLVATLAFLGRKALLEWVVKRVAHGFEKSIEDLRSNLRRQETELSSQLEKERVRLGRVQSTVLELMTIRRRRLDERTIESAERLWGHIVALAPGHTLAGIVAILRTDVIMKSAPRDERVSTLVKQFGPSFSTDDLTRSQVGINEASLYLPAKIWLLYSAYFSIITTCVAWREFVGRQIDVREYFNFDGVKAAVKAALPEYSEYVDKHEWNVTGFLMDDIKDRLLAEIRLVTLGEDSDRTAVVQASRLARAVEVDRATRVFEADHPELVRKAEPPPAPA